MDRKEQFKKVAIITAIAAVVLGVGSCAIQGTAARDGLCLLSMFLILALVVGSIIFAIYDSVESKKEKRREEEERLERERQNEMEARRREEERLERERQKEVASELDVYRRQVDHVEPMIHQLVKDTDPKTYRFDLIKWLQQDSVQYHTRVGIHGSELENRLRGAQTEIRSVDSAKAKFDAVARADDLRSERAALDRRYNEMHHLLNELPSRIQEWERDASRSKARAEEWHNLPAFTLMSETYGKPCQDAIAKADALLGGGDLSQRLSSFKDRNGLDDWLATDPSHLPALALAFARCVPANSVSIVECQRLWKQLVWKESCDIYISELCAKRQLGGDEAVRDAVSEDLRGPKRSFKWYETVASALMWLESYDSEKDVLQHMLSSNCPMSDTAKERLRYLSTSSDPVKVFDDGGDSDELLFDITSLSWDADQFSALFDNLVFKDKVLAYSLAVRDEDKSIGIPKGFSYPTRQQLFVTVEGVFEREYGNETEVTLKRCVALAEGVREEMDGIVAYARSHPDMAVVTITERIGSRLNIRFYTLFCPVGDVERDRVASRSLSMGLNPKASMWESALKETMLSGIQQALNSPTLDDGDLPEYF